MLNSSKTRCNQTCKDKKNKNFLCQIIPKRKVEMTVDNRIKAVKLASK